jgi:hypothetical protein
MLNADCGLSKLQSKQYIFYNKLNNYLGKNSTSNGLEIYDYKLKKLEEKLALQKFDSSPSRKLSDTFWMSINWKFIKTLLAEEINIFDSGCGSGVYLEKLTEYSTEKFNSYIGFDLVKRDSWQELKTKFDFPVQFKESSCENVQSLIEKQNLIISQSAIEHFPKDIDFFKKIGTYVNRVDHPVLQIHLIPAPCTLDLYLYHGIRQYNARTASKLVNHISSDFSYLVPLGGEQSYTTHYNWLTKRVLIDGKSDLRYEEGNKFSAEVNRSIINDNEKNQNILPHFYALVIGSNFGEKIKMDQFLQ